MAKRTSRPRRRGGLGSFYWVLLVVAIVGGGAVGLGVRSRRASAAGATGPVDMPELKDPTRLMAAARGEMKGDSAAPITIIEFADFQCPYCAKFGVEMEPQLEKDLLATGKAKLVFYDYPLVHAHEHAFLAARAARCAEDQGKFWPYHDALYKNQASWAPEKDPRARMGTLAQGVGVDPTAFAACLRSDQHADLVSANMELGKQLGVDRTPTFIVTQGGGIGQKVNPTVEDIEAAVDEMTDAGAKAGG
jgi:protein-disulfide isomerase